MQHLRTHTAHYVLWTEKELAEHFGNEAEWELFQALPDTPKANTLASDYYRWRILAPSILATLYSLPELHMSQERTLPGQATTSIIVATSEAAQHTAKHIHYAATLQLRQLFPQGIDPAYSLSQIGNLARDGIGPHALRKDWLPTITERGREWYLLAPATAGGIDPAAAIYHHGSGTWLPPKKQTTRQSLSLPRTGSVWIISNAPALALAQLPIKAGDHCIWLNRARHRHQLTMAGLTHTLLVRRGRRPAADGPRWFSPRTHDGMHRVYYLHDPDWRQGRPWWHRYKTATGKSPTTGHIAWHLARELRPTAHVHLVGFAPDRDTGTPRWQGHAWSYEAAAYAQAQAPIHNPTLKNKKA